MLEHLTAKSGLNGETAICFAYYNYRTPDSQNPKQIAAALLKQLCRHSPAVPPKLLSLKQAAHRPTLADIEQFLVKLPADMKLKQVYVVIDALDECDKNDRPRIIQLLSKIMEGVPCAKIFVTSRREGDIERAFTNSKTPTIQIQAKNVKADIRNFTESETTKLRHGHYGKKFFISSDDLAAKIIEFLTEKADGMHVTIPFWQLGQC